MQKQNIAMNSYLFRRAALALSLLLLLWGSSLAQTGDDDELGQFEIGVPKRYQAKVADALKITGKPSTQDTTVKKLPVRYSITPQPVKVEFHPEPLSAARISQMAVDELYQGMLNMGYGLYGTPLVEGYYNSERSSKYSFGVEGRHFSTQRGVEDIVFEDNTLSNNLLKGHFNRFYRKFTWENSLQFRHDKYSYYGFDSIAGLDPDTSSPQLSDVVRNEISVSTGIVESDADDLGVLEDLKLNYTYFQDDYAGRENFGELRSNWVLPVEDLDLDIAANVQYQNLQYDSLLINDTAFAQSYFTANLNPRVAVAYNDFQFNFGLNLYSVSTSSDFLDADSTAIYFFPQIQAQYVLVDEVLNIEGGITGGLAQNTYRDLSRQNPYLNPEQFSLPTRTTEIYAGLNGLLSGNTSFDLRVGYQIKKDMALYFRWPNYRSAPNRWRGLDVRYSDVEVFYLKGGVDAQLSEKLQLALSGKVQDFTVDDFGDAWHLPNLVGELDFRYLWLDKVKLTSHFTFVGSRTAFEANAGDLDPELDPYFNWDAGVEYLYNSRLSAYLKGHNLLNQNYQLYLGYPTQNINVLMGFTYRF